MKKTILLLLVFLPLVGCDSLKRLTEGATSTPPSQAPRNNDDFFETGTTTADYQSVYMPVTGRTLTVEVLRPGETVWITLKQVDPPFNPYQIFDIPSEGIHFGDRAEEDAKGNLTLWTGTPAAPKGTQYRIHNVKN